MGVASRFMLKFENDNVEATNYQEFGIELDADVDTIGLAQVTAQIIAYTTIACRWVSDQHTKLTGITYRAPGATVSNPVPFPTDTYADIYAANIGDWPKLVGITDYGQDLGETGNALSPLGTSIVVSEYSTTGGPSGRGRHFLPFVGKFSVTGGGTVEPTHRAGIEAAYRGFIMGFAPVPDLCQALDPVVENSLGTTMKPIVTVKCQPVFSNLESRRR